MNAVQQPKKKTLWQKWKFIAEKIGNFQGRLILTVMYFTVFAIPGIVVTLTKDYLRIKKKQTIWIERKKFYNTMEEAKEQW